MNRAIDLEAFCDRRLALEDVTTTLRALSFELVFQMGEVPPRKYTHIPAQPAQYRYSDPYGTEVIYLAGRDENLNGIRLPLHASRFWLFAGSSLSAYQQVATTLTTKWGFGWCATEMTQANCSQVLQETKR